MSETSAERMRNVKSIGIPFDAVLFKNGIAGINPADRWLRP
jgi:hypothetical protein